MPNNSSYYIKTMFSTRQARRDGYILRDAIWNNLHTAFASARALYACHIWWNNVVNQTKVAVTPNHL